MRRLLSVIGLVGLCSAAACQSGPPAPTPPPDRPTLAPSPTLLPSPTVMATPDRRPEMVETPPPPRQTSTPPPTYTPAPARPTLTAGPPSLPPPPTATPDVLGQIPVAVVVEGETRTVTVSDAQLNTLIAAHFDAAPLPGYAVAPRAEVGEGLIHLSAPIRLAEGEGATAVPTTLSLDFAIVRGDLETRPMRLTPRQPGLSLSAKRGEKLLLSVVWGLAEAAAQGQRFFFSRVAIRPGQVQFTIVLVKG